MVTDEEIEFIYKTSEFTDPIGFLRGFPKYEVPIDFDMLVKKPYGLFGRTGMGKSILNKILCLFIIKHNVSQLLLFDMQGEYGMISRADKSKGLAWYYPDKIQIYRLGELDKKEKITDGAEPFFIYKDNISSGDIIASAQTLNEPSINVLIYIENLVRDNPDDYDNLLYAINTVKANDHESINALSLRALRNRIIRFDNYRFLKERGEKKRDDSLKNLFNNLIEGKSIVIDFGKYGTNRHLYYFIANMITRRLYQMYSQREDESDLPPLVVVLEEAHKFLQPGVIRYTIFDRIAREMRKFQLTLAFVDQRPSQIDDEVFSQIANRFVFHLNDDKDINRVVKNLPSPRKWRSFVSGLLKRQCFIYGDAIAVPTILEVMNYNDEKLLKAKLGITKTLTETLKVVEKTDMTKIFPDDD
jgi:DNA helicase HerA-like ATPase